MSAIDIVLVVIALVAVGVAVACALQLKGLRAELRERGDNGAEMLAALEQANNALDTLNVALAETRRTANAIAQQQTTDAAVEQQHADRDRDLQPVAGEHAAHQQVGEPARKRAQSVQYA